jgi:hypothetical protein
MKCSTVSPKIIVYTLEQRLLDREAIDPPGTVHQWVQIYY